MLRPYSIGALTGKVLLEASPAGVDGRVFPALLNFNNFVQRPAAGRAEFVVDWLSKLDGSWAARLLRSRPRAAP